MNVRTTRIFRKACAALVAVSAWAPPGALPQAGPETDDRNYWLELRLRNEQVDQDNALEDADALTLRARIGYETEPRRGFRFLVEAESVVALGDDYNSTTSGRTGYAVVADPEGSEINRALVAYDGLPDTEFALGRQRIVLDNSRFVGNVDWRQNEQTFDAVSVTNTSVRDLTMRFAYIDNVRRIFGWDSDVGSIDMSSPIVNLRYTGLPGAALTLYGYFLDFDDAPASSNRTLGLRVTGTKTGATVQWNYELEFAQQADYKGGDSIIDADYLLGNLGATMGHFGMGVGYERLDGDGSYAFQTPLATGHAFDGWADQFLSTPATGLVDRSVTASAKVKGATLRLVYHRFDAAAGSARYGTEYDLLASRNFGRQLSGGIKFADYRADAWLVDTTKLWLFAQYRY